jgi:hypothetical protein
LFDHRGGPNGGIEIVTYPTVIPDLYAVGVQNTSGATATATIQVFLNKVPQKIFVGDPFNLPTSFTDTIGPGRSTAVIAGIGRKVPGTFASPLARPLSAQPRTAGPLPVRTQNH